MIYTDKQVWEVCKVVAPKLEIDAYLAMALCEQECSHKIGKGKEARFDITKYDASVSRLEQNFYDRYTRDFEYSTGVETLLASSYSVMQMMGESLRECTDPSGRNFFEWYFWQQAETVRENLLFIPMSPVCVINAIDFYCDHLDISIEWGCRWFLKKKKLASGSVQLALQYWNGGSNKNYSKEVLERIPRLQKTFMI